MKISFGIGSLIPLVAVVFPVWAQQQQNPEPLQLISITGVSNYQYTRTTSRINIYGGMAGDMTRGTCTSTNNVDPCNSCDTSFAKATRNAGCNRGRIYDSLKLTVRFNVPANFTGSGRVAIKSGSLALREISTVTYAAGQTAEGSLTWLDLCQYLESTLTSCENWNLSSAQSLQLGIATGSDALGSPAYSVNLHLVPEVMNSSFTDSLTSTCAAADGVSSPSHGACDFEIFPGDEKAYIVDVSVPSAFPTAGSGVQYEKIRYFYSDNPSELVPNFEKFKDISIQTDSTPGSSSLNFGGSFVDGLENGKLYHFMAATVDIAQNMGYFIQPTVAAKHTVRPDKVNGLLKDDMSCFIATAAQGSNLHPMVVDLRKFRNKFLLSSKWGRKVVRLYYQWSPPFARWIAGDETRQTVARAALWPFWRISQLTTQFGWFQGWSLIAGLLLLVAVAAATLRPRGGGPS